MNTPDKKYSLPKLLREQLIPLARERGEERLVVARLLESEMNLPEPVRMSAAPKLGRRVAVRGKRRCGNAHIITAQWPDDGQETLRIPLLFHVLQGNADLRFGEYFLHCPPGVSVLVLPGVPHPGGRQSYIHGKERENDHCSMLVMSPRERQMQCWIAHGRGSRLDTPENYFVLTELLTDYLDRMVEELTVNRPGALEISSALLQVLWRTLERELVEGNFFGSQEMGTGLETHWNDQIGYDPIDHAQQYIQSHLAQALTLESVAQTVHLSSTQFARLFRQQTGSTFVSYVNDLRLQKACLFLRETTWTLTYISGFCGFKSVSYFHHLFRSRIGVSPQQYRKNTFPKQVW